MSDTADYERGCSQIATASEKKTLEAVTNLFIFNELEGEMNR